MKKIFFFIVAVLFISSSVITGRSESSDNNNSDKKIKKQESVKKAVEAKSFIIELNRLYMSRSGFVDLLERNNYIVIDGNKTEISAGYMGRQSGLYAIAGIRVGGKPSVFKMKKNDSRGKYEIEIEIKGDTDTFHITMTISENGYCNAWISGMKIENTRYSGILVPLEKEEKVSEPDAIRL